MSVHESSSQRTGEAGAGYAADEAQADVSGVEYAALRAGSLAMYAAVVGGAILGLLLTLLVLAFFNGGMLSFNVSTEQLTSLEAGLQRVNENVDTVSINADIVASQATANQAQMAASTAARQKERTLQSAAIAANEEAVNVLGQTRAQFDILVTALADALGNIETGVGDAAENALALAEETAAIGNEAAAVALTEAAGTGTAATILPVPMVANRADLSARHVVVVLFADANNDGFMDEGETNLMGVTVSLLDGSGKAVAAQTSTESGAFFEELAPGAYQLVVEDDLGYALLSQSSATVVIDEDDGQGYAVYMPASTTAE